MRLASFIVHCLISLSSRQVLAHGSEPPLVLPAVTPLFEGLGAVEMVLSEASIKAQARLPAPLASCEHRSLNSPTNTINFLYNNNNNNMSNKCQYT